MPVRAVPAAADGHRDAVGGVVAQGGRDTALVSAPCDQPRTFVGGTALVQGSCRVVTASSPGRSTSPRKSAAKTAGAWGSVDALMEGLLRDRASKATARGAPTPRSEVGLGTIYRRFPNKSALVERVAIDVMSGTFAVIDYARRHDAGHCPSARVTCRTKSTQLAWRRATGTSHSLCR